MPDHGTSFLARVEQDLPPIDWADADRVRHRGQARRSRRRAVQLTGALVAVLALVVVGATITRPDQAAPVPIQQLKDMQLSPDLCAQPWLVAAMHLEQHPCATTSSPGTYLDANHGLNSTDPFVVTLPAGWSFQSLAPHGLGSQVDLVADDNTQGIRIATYVGWATAGHRVGAESGGQLLHALRRVPGLYLSPETKVRIGGEPATQVDITGGPGLPRANADCLIGAPCFPLFRQVPIGGFGPPPDTVGAIPGTTSRLIFLSSHASGAVPTLIWIWDRNPSSGFQNDLQRAQPIVDSLDLSPPRLPGN